MIQGDITLNEELVKINDGNEFTALSRKEREV